MPNFTNRNCNCRGKQLELFCQCYLDSLNQGERHVI